MRSAGPGRGPRPAAMIERHDKMKTTTLHRTVTAAAVLAVLLLAAPDAPGELRAMRMPNVDGVAGAAPTGPAALHIKRAKNVSFRSYYIMNDGGGYRWDLQYYGNIYQGTSGAYSGAMYCHINGSNFQAPNYAGWVNKTGDEVEMGPHLRSGLIVHRRIKVYKNLPLARWLDIFQNPSTAPVTVSIRMYICTNHAVSRTQTSTGGTAFSEKDFAFVIQTSNPTTPSTLHVVTSKGAKLRPSVMVQSNQVYVNYSLTVPAKKTAILCHFESQGRNTVEHVKLMKNFPAYRLLRDLPGAVRQLIVNMRVLGGYAGVDLERMEITDSVHVEGAGPLYGTIANKAFKLRTVMGQLDVPTERMVGMAAGMGNTVRFALTDGQVLSAETPDETLNLDLPTGGTLRIPLARISQWSYRLSAGRPDGAGFSGPFVRLRTGDHLLIDPASVKLSFRTRHGIVPLDPKTLFKVVMDNPGNAVHQVLFLNGSHLAGFVEPNQLKLKLTFGRTLTVRRDLIADLTFAPEDKPGTQLSALVLTNEDELFGHLVDGDIEIVSEFGTVRAKPSNIKAAVFSTQRVGHVNLQLWDGSEISGQIGAKPLAFRIIPGPTLSINPLQFAVLTRSEALPPAHVVAAAKKLIKQLGHDDYKVRKAATEKLVKMGKSIAPILTEHLKTTDPEVRQRLEEIIQTLGVPKPATPAPAQPGPQIFLQGRAGGWQQGGAKWKFVAQQGQLILGPQRQNAQVLIRD